MLVLVLLLLALGCLVGFYTLFSNNNDNANVPAQKEAASSCSTCSGYDPQCRLTCNMEAATKDIVYYDDEELDVFRLRASDSYTEEEIGMFEEVLSTMKAGEVEDWCRSLSLRQISLPDCLKDDVVMLINS